MSAPETIVITGCDRNHFHLAEDFVASFRAVHGDSHRLGFINFCGTELPQAIAAAVDEVHDGAAGYAAFDPKSGFYVAREMFKARLPALFPGYRVYCWIDADCWVQTPHAVEKMAAFARQFDICIHPEFDIHYRFYPTPSQRTRIIYTRVYGEAALADQPLDMPMINSGVYAMRADSRGWALWEAEMAGMNQRFDAGAASFLCDQTTLHRVLCRERLNFFPLRATDNWQLYACRPRIDRQRRLLTVPTPPFEPLSILHLAGATKDLEMARTPDGRALTYRWRDVGAFWEAAG